MPDRGAAVRARELVVIAILMVALTAVMTYPQIVRLDAVPDLGDPVFAVWRLKWVAHQLPRDPLHLFDANTFYPTRNTLALSEPLLLPGLIAAPFVWLGVPGPQIYNVFFLATFVLAGVAMYTLMRTVTGSIVAALVSGVAFAFYPFRFQHYSHFEHQLSFWMPLALLALHRTLAHGRLRDGLLTGAALGSQLLSSLYLGVFLSAYLVPVGGAIALGWRRIGASVKPLLAGAAVTLLFIAPLVRPYLYVRSEQGERSRQEVAYYSARAEHYLAPNARNITYATGLGPIHTRGDEPERSSFPGILVVALALVAVWPPLSAARIAYTLGLAFAFEASLGTHGYTFPTLAEHLLPFRGLRVPARFSMLVGLSLSVLAGYGAARLAALPRRRWFGHAVAALLAFVVLFESRSTIDLTPIPRPHAVYQWFEQREPGIVAELPSPGGPQGWRADCRYMYASTFYWPRLLGGYAGGVTPSYRKYTEATKNFPDERSMRFLHERSVNYIVIHEDEYGRERYGKVTEALGRRTDVREVIRAVDQGYEARIYQVVKYARATGCGESVRGRDRCGQADRRAAG